MWRLSRGGRLLLSALLLLSVSAYGTYSETYYSISESELTELESILTEQRNTIESLTTTLDAQRNRLTLLSETIARQQTLLTAQWTTIDELRTSFSEYESAARSSTIRVGAVSFSVGVAIGTTLVLIFR